MSSGRASSWRRKDSSSSVIRGMISARAEIPSKSCASNASSSSFNISISNLSSGVLFFFIVRAVFSAQRVPLVLRLAVGRIYAYT